MTIPLMKTPFVFLGLLILNPIFSQDLSSIKDQLQRIEQQNLELRSLVMPTIRKYGPKSFERDSLNEQILKFDSTSLGIVIKIIDEYGWLGKSQIGEIANRALFLVIQHAADNETRKKYYPLLLESATEGESDLAAMATMHDRILVQDGELQMYGTQSRMVDGKLEPFPILDPKRVNKRRRAVGLGKLK